MTSYRPIILSSDLFIKHSGDLWRVLKAAVFVFGLTNGCRSDPGVGLLHGTR